MLVFEPSIQDADGDNLTDIVVRYYCFPSRWWEAVRDTGSGCVPWDEKRLQLPPLKKIEKEKEKKCIDQHVGLATWR